MDVIIPTRQIVTPPARGYTLIELVVTLSIGIILIGMAIPAFSNLIDDNRLSTRVNEFTGHLNYARSEAIKTGYRVNVCKSLDGTDCDNTGEWHEGWIIFIDEDGDRQRSSQERLLQAQQPLPPLIAIDYGAFPTDNYVVYYPTGRSLGNGTFTFCDQRGADEARALVLYKTGRLRSARTMPDGSPLDCP